MFLRVGSQKMPCRGWNEQRSWNEEFFWTTHCPPLMKRGRFHPVKIVAVSVLLLTVQSAEAMRVYPQQGRTVVLLYNKPPDVVTTRASDDIKGRINIFEDIFTMKGFRPGRHERTVPHLDRDTLSLEEMTGVMPSSWSTIGRLDADTSGLLLLTNDGNLVHHVTNKSASTAKNSGPISKTYEALVMGFHKEDSPIFNQMRSTGVDIGSKYGGLTLPVQKLSVLDHPTQKSTVVSVTIVEGKNRQVRRMFHALGSGVMKLKRTQIGDSLTLEDLSEGEWRILSDDEVYRGLNWEPRPLDQSDDTDTGRDRNRLKVIGRGRRRRGRK